MVTDALVPEIEITNLVFCPQGVAHLFEARAAAQKKIKAIKKNSVNPYFKSKYADLEAIIEATADAIAEQGLAFIQCPIVKGNSAGVTTVLGHSSGEWMRGDLLLPLSKADAQGIGSAITYARRYAKGAFLDVAAEADDDANAAAGKETEAKAATMPRPPKKPGAFIEKTNGEMEAHTTFTKHFWATAKKNGKSEEQVREFFGSIGYEHTAEIPPTKYAECYAWAETR